MHTDRFDLDSYLNTSLGPFLGRSQLVSAKTPCAAENMPEPSSPHQSSISESSDLAGSVISVNSPTIPPSYPPSGRCDGISSSKRKVSLISHESVDTSDNLYPTFSIASNSQTEVMNKNLNYLSFNAAISQDKPHNNSSSNFILDINSETLNALSYSVKSA